MEILVFILVGLIVGALARFLLPGADPIGFLGTLVLGILGAIVGGYLWTALIGGDGGFIGAVIAAMLLLALYRSLTYRRSAY